jgi:hypothetical protein
METMNADELLRALQDLGITLQRAKALVDDGKEVACSQKLQGALVKCGNLVRYVNEFRATEDTSEAALDEVQNESVVKESSEQPA